MKEMNNEMELNMDELEQVNGGYIFCFIWGCSDNDGEAATCFSEGGSASFCELSGESGTDNGYGGAACLLAFGLGFMLS